jgi:hypothetical protein
MPQNAQKDLQQSARISEILLTILRENPGVTVRALRDLVKDRATPRGTGDGVFLTVMPESMTGNARFCPGGLFEKSKPNSMQDCLADALTFSQRQISLNRRQRRKRRTDTGESSVSVASLRSCSNPSRALASRRGRRSDWSSDVGFWASARCGWGDASECNALRRSRSTVRNEPKPFQNECKGHWALKLPHFILCHAYAPASGLGWLGGASSCH